MAKPPNLTVQGKCWDPGEWENIWKEGSDWGFFCFIIFQENIYLVIHANLFIYMYV